MKQFFFIFSIALLTTACSGTSGNEYKIDASIEGIDNGSTVILRKLDQETQPVDGDSTTVNDGKFIFKGSRELPEIHFMYIEGAPGVIRVIAEIGTIKIRSYKDSLYATHRSGTVTNEAFQAFIEESNEIAEVYNKTRNEISIAANARDTVAFSMARDKMISLEKEIDNLEYKHILLNPSSYLSVLLLEGIVQAQSQPTDVIEDLYNKIPSKFKNTSTAKNITKAIEANAATSIGVIAPDFTAPSPSKEEVTLSKVEGKLILLDFWAAWCRPCREENPNIVAVYEKYKDKGFNVVGFSLDRNEADWKKAIVDDKLDWIHASNIQFWNDPVARMYNITAIPKSFLLDENKRIIATDLRGAQLEAAVRDFFEKN